MIRTIFLLSLGFIFSNTFAQQNISLTGQIKNIGAAEIIYLGTENFLLPLDIDLDGNFSITIEQITTPSFFYFQSISSRGKLQEKSSRIWFESEQIEINLDWKNKTYKAIPELRDYQQISEDLEALKNKTKINYILNNPIHSVSLYFAEYEKEKIPLNKLEELLSKITPEYENTIYTKRIANYLNAKKLPKPRKNKSIMNFKLKDKYGNKTPIINSNGKTQLIALFSSGCPYSLASINTLEQLHHNSDIEIISIWEDKTKDIWLNSHPELKEKISWTDLWDEYGLIFTYFNSKISPSFYVIDNEGKLVGSVKGINHKKLNKLLEIN